MAQPNYIPEPLWLMKCSEEIRPMFLWPNSWLAYLNQEVLTIKDGKGPGDWATADAIIRKGTVSFHVGNAMLLHDCRIVFSARIKDGHMPDPTILYLGLETPHGEYYEAEYHLHSGCSGHVRRVCYFEPYKIALEDLKSSQPIFYDPRSRKFYVKTNMPVYGDRRCHSGQLAICLDNGLPSFTNIAGMEVNRFEIYQIAPVTGMFVDHLELGAFFSDDRGNLYLRADGCSADREHPYNAVSLKDGKLTLIARGLVTKIRVGIRLRSAD